MRTDEKELVSKLKALSKMLKAKQTGMLKDMASAGIMPSSGQLEDVARLEQNIVAVETLIDDIQREDA